MFINSTQFCMFFSRRWPRYIDQGSLSYSPSQIFRGAQTTSLSCSACGTSLPIGVSWLDFWKALLASVGRFSPRWIAISFRFCLLNNTAILCSVNTRRLTCDIIIAALEDVHLIRFDETIIKVDLPWRKPELCVEDFTCHGKIRKEPARYLQLFNLIFNCMSSDLKGSKLTCWLWLFWLLYGRFTLQFMHPPQGLSCCSVHACRQWWPLLLCLSFNQLMPRNTRTKLTSSSFRCYMYVC